MLESQLQSLRSVATSLFALAVLHTFLANPLRAFAHRFPKGSLRHNIFELLGEIEVVFGLWAAMLIAYCTLAFGDSVAVDFLESVDYAEAVFVFVIMSMAATRPVLALARNIIDISSRALPVSRPVARYFATLVIGPLLGSIITEPAAMTVTAILLRDAYMDERAPPLFKYATLALLFVNVSVGGALTHFAAPPVLMVARVWGWDTPFMLATFGWRAVAIVVTGALITTLVFRRSISNATSSTTTSQQSSPIALTLVHIAFLAATIRYGHHIAPVLALLLFFLGTTLITAKYQDKLELKSSLLVAFFLAGLVTLGKLQDWWLTPLVAGLAPYPLFFGATALTAIADNAALTYLGTLVPNLSVTARYALVAGALAGGGLTVIANAPNPVGFGLLRPAFGESGVNPFFLCLAALPYTALAAIFFLFGF